MGSVMAQVEMESPQTPRAELLATLWLWPPSVTKSSDISCIAGKNRSTSVSNVQDA